MSDVKTTVDRHVPVRPLYFFVDESGSLGDVPSAKTDYFILTGVMSERPFPCETALLKLKYQLMACGFNVEEYHSIAMKHNYVRAFVLGRIRDNAAGLKAYSIVVNKKLGQEFWRKKIYPRAISLLISYMLDHNQDWVSKCDGLTIVTDTLPDPPGAERNTIEADILEYLNIAIPIIPQRKSCYVFHHKSESSVMLQVADFVSWCVWRFVKHGEAWWLRELGDWIIDLEYDPETAQIKFRQQSDRSYNILPPRGVGNVTEFVDPEIGGGRRKNSR